MKNYLLGNEPLMNAMRFLKRLFVIMLAIMASALLYCFVIMAFNWFTVHYGAIDYQRWANDNHGASGKRYRVADQIVAQGSLLGMSKEGVIEVLGNPVKDSYFIDHDMIYRIGFERGFLYLSTQSG